MEARAAGGDFLLPLAVQRDLQARSILKKPRLLGFFMKTNHLTAYATMKRNGVVKRI